jgi:hypothetical protein
MNEEEKKKKKTRRAVRKKEKKENCELNVRMLRSWEEEEERTRKKNLISYATDVALPFFIPTSYFSRLRIFI